MRGADPSRARPDGAGQSDARAAERAGGRTCGYLVDTGCADKVGDLTIVVGKDFDDWKGIGCG